MSAEKAGNYLILLSFDCRNLNLGTPCEHGEMSDFRRKKLLHVFNVFFGK
jgi:hypothetical protein